MNYKLINRTTSEETMCSKVVINGFDYYVSKDIIAQEGDIATVPEYASLVIVEDIDDMPYSVIHRRWNGLFCDTCFGIEDATKFKKVIATNNPSIDLPKVVDIVEELAWDTIKGESSLKTDSDKIIGFTGFVEGYYQSQESHPNSDEDMIEFLKFHQKTAILSFDSTAENHGKSYKELLQIWKEQKPKILYYE